MWSRPRFDHHLLTSRDNWAINISIQSSSLMKGMMTTKINFLSAKDNLAKIGLLGLFHFSYFSPGKIKVVLKSFISEM